jgi:hypothetical protein
MATILQRSPQRADLRGFVLATSLLGMILTTIATVAIGRLWPVGFGALVAALSLALGMWRPQSFLMPYRVFNRLAADVSRLTATAVGLVSFYFVIGSASLAGSRLQRAKPARVHSGWRRREPVEVTSLWKGPMKRQPHGWVSDYASWASSGERLWAWCLLPFLMMLSAVALEDDDIVSEGNYTLF